MIGTVRRIVLALVLVASAAGLALANCGGWASEGTSRDGKVKVEPKVDGTITVSSLASGAFVVEKTGNFTHPKFDHPHIKVMLEDDGARFVLFDDRNGVHVFKRDLTLVGSLTAEDILAPAERVEWRRRSDGCHHTSAWTEGTPVLRDGKLGLILASKRVTFVSLDSGRLADRWLCAKCVGAPVTTDIGKCACGHVTASGMYRRCPPCAIVAKTCALCPSALD